MAPSLRLRAPNSGARPPLLPARHPIRNLGQAAPYPRLHRTGYPPPAPTNRKRTPSPERTARCVPESPSADAMPPRQNGPASHSAAPGLLMTCPKPPAAGAVGLDTTATAPRSHCLYSGSPIRPRPARCGPRARYRRETLPRGGSADSPSPVPATNQPQPALFR